MSLCQYLTDGSLEEALRMAATFEIDGKQQKISDHTNLLACISKMKPKNMLQYITGAECEPGTGWPKRPSIEFEHKSQSSYPKVSTCALTITLPITKSNEDPNVSLFVFSTALIEGGHFTTV